MDETRPPLTINEAFKKMCLRWNMAMKEGVMDLFLDAVPKGYPDYTVRAIMFFALEAKERPTPAAIGGKFWEIKHKIEKELRQQERGPAEIPLGCEKCSSGRVHFHSEAVTMRGKKYYRAFWGMCAICNLDPFPGKFYVQMGDEIYEACKQIRQNLYIPTPNQRVLIKSLTPIHTNEFLADSFRMGPVPCPKEYIDKLLIEPLAASLRIIRARGLLMQEETKKVPF